MALARRVAPHLPVHASTQQSIASSEGAEFARRRGAERVVVGRELSVAEIAAVVAHTAAEVECFVHGALCVSWSGQCLSSEAWGGRSANRGQCAQACRLPYEVLVDGAGDQADGAATLNYALSPQDLCGLDDVEASTEPPPYTIRGRRGVVAQRQDLDGAGHVGRAVRDDVLRRSGFPIERRELGALLRIRRDADAASRQDQRHRAATRLCNAIRLRSVLAAERLEEARRWRGVRPQRRAGRAVEQNTRDGLAERIHKRLDVPGRPARGEDEAYRFAGAAQRCESRGCQLVVRVERRAVEV